MKRGRQRGRGVLLSLSSVVNNCNIRNGLKYRCCFSKGYYYSSSTSTTNSRVNTKSNTKPLPINRLPIEENYEIEEFDEEDAHETVKRNTMRASTTKPSFNTNKNSTTISSHSIRTASTTANQQSPFMTQSTKSSAKPLSTTKSSPTTKKKIIDQKHDDDEEQLLSQIEKSIEETEPPLMVRGNYHS